MYRIRDLVSMAQRNLLGDEVHEPAPTPPGVSQPSAACDICGHDQQQHGPRGTLCRHCDCFAYVAPPHADPAQPRAVDRLPESVRPMLNWLLLRIGGWTQSRWDQWLRWEYGDERAEAAIQWLSDALHDEHCHRGATGRTCELCNATAPTPPRAAPAGDDPAGCCPCENPQHHIEGCRYEPNTAARLLNDARADAARHYQDRVRVSAALAEREAEVAEIRSTSAGRTERWPTS